MATCPRILGWKSPWTEEPGGYSAWGHKRVGHDLVTKQQQLLYTEWINYQVLLYSTENYCQYPMVNHNGKEYFKRIYISVTESLCCIAEIKTL